MFSYIKYTILGFIVLLISIISQNVLKEYYSEKNFVAHSCNYLEGPLSDDLQLWMNYGKYINIHDRQMFVIDTNDNNNNNRTFMLVHGFPSSSYDYHHIIKNLSNYGRVITFDHIGFGFSEKPLNNYKYSIAEHCDNLIKLCMILNLNNIIFIAHDMGDSVIAELISRRYRQLLPNNFNKNLINAIIFTNGGMKVDMINFRLDQRLLLSPLGKFFNHLGFYVNNHLTFNRQLRSIWGNKNHKNMQTDIDSLHQLNECNYGFKIMYKLIYYINDRYDFEYKWIQALQHFDRPVMVMWGDHDAVSPVKIAQSIYNDIGKFVDTNTNTNTNTTSNSNSNIKLLTFLENTGHFLTLEQPELWLTNIIHFLNKI